MIAIVSCRFRPFKSVYKHLRNKNDHFLAILWVRLYVVEEAVTGKYSFWRDVRRSLRTPAKDDVIFQALNQSKLLISFRGRVWREKEHRLSPSVHFEVEYRMLTIILSHTLELWNSISHLRAHMKVKVNLFISYRSISKEKHNKENKLARQDTQGEGRVDCKMSLQHWTSTTSKTHTVHIRGYGLIWRQRQRNTPHMNKHWPKKNI